jgi:hypothetical protein
MVLPQVLERLVLQVCMRRLCTARMYGHTHTGRMSQAGEGVESRDRLGDERTKAAQACSETEWYCVGQRVGRGGVGFSDEICFCLVREIVTFAVVSTVL